jgi:hypothetical protein
MKKQKKQPHNFVEDDTLAEYKTPDYPKMIKTNQVQVCTCGHTIDSHIEQYKGIVRTGQCFQCDCKIYSQQERKEGRTLSSPPSGVTKQGGIKSQDDIKLQIERSASLPVDNHPADNSSSQNTKDNDNTTT